MHDPEKKPIAKISSEKYFKERKVAIETTMVTANEIKLGILDLKNFDLFYMLGRYAPNFYNALGFNGHAKIREFVESGGGFVGICAGAYFGAKCGCGIGLIDTEIFDIDHWARGASNACEIRFTKEAPSLLGNKWPMPFRGLKVVYVSGPMLKPGPNSTSILDFWSDLRGLAQDIKTPMKGNSAITIGQCGKGRVVLISAHCESAKSPKASHDLLIKLF